MSDNEKTFGFTRNGFIYLHNVRVQPFAAITNPSPNLSGKDQYSVTCEISEEQFAFLEGEMKKAAERQWKDKAQAMWARLDDKNKGARKFHIESNGTSYLGVRASRYTVDSRGNPIKAPLIRQGAGGKVIEPGDYVLLCITPIAYDFNGVRGVKFDFVAIAYEKQGDRLGGRKYAEESEFEGLVSDKAEVPDEW